MIKKILLSNVATYSEPVEIVPSQINFLYGNNGSGKTTISNLIASEENYQDCSLEWSDGVLERFVYNKKFVEKNFVQNIDIEGIFTLGEDSVETFENIKRFRDRIVDIDKNIKRYRNTIADQSKDLEKIKKDFVELCWNRKSNYEKYFKDVFVGYLSSKSKFSSECVRLFGDKSFEEYNFELLRKEYDELFNSTLKEINVNLATFKLDLQSIEDSSLLSEIIISKNVGVIADLINRLESTDWMAEGLSLLKDSEGKCPFCQQEISAEIAKKHRRIF